MGASPEEKRPVLPPVHGTASRRRDYEEPMPNCRCCLGVTGIVVVLNLILQAMLWFIDQSSMSPEYTVAITAVSGLDPAATPGTPRSRGVLLYPVFNLTVGVASHSVMHGGCVEPGTAVRVSYSYLRLPMASGRAPDMCVGPRQSAERGVVARGREVALPGFLVDSLAEDMRRGEAAFEVKLTTLQEEEWEVVTCWVKAGNAGAGAGASKPCVRSFTAINDMPQPQQGDFGYVKHPIPAAVPVPVPP